MKKVIQIQTQNIQARNISPVKQVGFVSVNTDNIKLIIDAYNGSGATATPRTNSLIRIIDDKTVYELTPESLLQAVKFFQRYAEMGSAVVSFRNLFHVVIPDHYKNALKQRETGLKF